MYSQSQPRQLGLLTQKIRDKTFTESGKSLMCCHVAKHLNHCMRLVSGWQITDSIISSFLNVKIVLNNVSPDTCAYMNVIILNMFIYVLYFLPIDIFGKISFPMQVSPFYLSMVTAELQLSFPLRSSPEFDILEHREILPQSSHLSKSQTAFHCLWKWQTITHPLEV